MKSQLSHLFIGLAVLIIGIIQIVTLKIGALIIHDAIDFRLHRFGCLRLVMAVVLAILSIWLLWETLF
ncbi:MAG: hypothetical protein HPY81_02540 [Firmicutes bacterium]|nr:hypothetical protein [Bacillota bacterium]